MMRDPRAVDCKRCDHDNEAHDPLLGCVICPCNTLYPKPAAGAPGSPYGVVETVTRSAIYGHQQHALKHRHLSREIARMWFWISTNTIIGVLTILLFAILLVVKASE